MSKERPLTYSISTFGCKVNTYDSGLIETHLQQNHFASEQTSVPRVHILNSCAVTAEATQEVIRRARKLKRDQPASVVVVTGCAAQVDTEKLSAASSIDLIIANSHKSQLANLIEQHVRGDVDLARVHKSNIFKKEEFGSGGGLESEHTRAFLKIQDGCNSFCTFCVIPFARGKSRSLPIEDLRVRVNELLSQGAREVVLTGVHIGDYEFGLENLIEDLLLRTRVPRLRLTSLEPVELNDRLLELYNDPRMCRHFHMSIQSATTSVLTSMKRKYTAEHVEAALEQIAARVPGAFVGMDVIVGFKNESDDDFAETYERLDRLPWTRIHVFPYSERPGTYATRLPNHVPQHIIARRADRLRTLSRDRYLAAAQKQIGLTKKALLLKGSKALSRDYWSIQLPEAHHMIPGSEAAITITGLAQTAHRAESALAGIMV